ncbi:hypothetical protein [Lacticaseibacillus porcinae]|uniref:hypothetical protein n=1 Tax=Lacticaseibacillus porcinae TaxID=1123687 RepID=UPI0013DE21A6|nr:hypothetical protein [Lacticaseibacillus porcinae]
MQIKPLDEEQMERVAGYVQQRNNLLHNRNFMTTLELAGIYITEKSLGADVDAYSTQTTDGRPWIVMSTE